VTARGNNRRQLFLDDADRRSFLRGLTRVVETFNWRCLAMCLMDNHFHLLIKTLEPNLGEGMKDLNQPHAQRFNRRYGNDGHLFQGRYYSSRVLTDRYLLACVRYVVQNPVRAGLCESPDRWAWSSHNITMKREQHRLVAVAELLRIFDEDPERARERYSAFVHERPDPASVVQLREARLMERSAPRPLHALLGAAPTADDIAEAYYGDGYDMKSIAQSIGCDATTVGRRIKAWRVQAGV